MQLTLEICIELKLNRFLLYFHYIHLFFKIRFNIKINYFLNDFYSLK
jgi:hypothetical protein